MNVENIRKVINAIREHEDQFSMQRFVKCENPYDHVAPNDENPEDSDTLDSSSSPLHNCGTVCCIGGWVNALRAAETNSKFVEYADMLAACEYLGIPAINAYPLFYPGSQSHIWNQAKELGLVQTYNCFRATVDEAIAVLEAIIDGRIKLLDDF